MTKVPSITLFLFFSSNTVGKITPIFPGPTSGTVRRRATVEEDTSSDTSAHPPKKRIRTLVPKLSGATALPTIALRPPSPTSMSDVTSSTAPASQISNQEDSTATQSHNRTRPAVPPTGQSAFEPIASTSSGQEAAPVASTELAVNTAVVSGEDVAGFSGGVSGQEEGMVDSSAEVGQGSSSAAQMDMTPPEQYAEAPENEVRLDCLVDWFVGCLSDLSVNLLFKFIHLFIHSSVCLKLSVSIFINVLIYLSIYLFDK